MLGVKNSSKIILLKRPETKIGRNRGNHVILDKCLKISRFHAVIKFFDDIPFIKDLSEWGVYLNGNSLPRNRWVEVAVGDAVAFGASSVEDGGLVLEIVELELESEEIFNEIDNIVSMRDYNIVSMRDYNTLQPCHSTSA